MEGLFVFGGRWVVWYGCGCRGVFLCFVGIVMGFYVGVDFVFGDFVVVVGVDLVEVFG